MLDKKIIKLNYIYAALLWIRGRERKGVNINVKTSAVNQILRFYVITRSRVTYTGNSCLINTIFVHNESVSKIQKLFFDNWHVISFIKTIMVLLQRHISCLMRGRKTFSQCSRECRMWERQRWIHKCGCSEMWHTLAVYTQDGGD